MGLFDPNVPNFSVVCSKEYLPNRYLENVCEINVPSTLFFFFFFLGFTNIYSFS